MEIFEYAFMQKAFIVGLLISVITPAIGLIVVLKRLSMIGDALSHNALAGVAAGLAFGFNPIIGAVGISILSAFGIEKIRKAFPKYSELSIAIIMATGIGLAGIFSGFVKNTAVFTSFLFGSIVAITDFELYIVLILSVVVIIALIIMYKELFYITFDEESARLAGVPVKLVDFIFTLLTAITISISARTVGALVISSLMVIPVATSMQLAKSYKQTIIFSVLFGMFFTIFGIFISYYLGLKPGATIVITGVIILVLTIALRAATGKKTIKSILK